MPGQLSDPGMDSYHTQFDLNLTAQVALTKLAVPHLLKVKGQITSSAFLDTFLDAPHIETKNNKQTYILSSSKIQTQQKKKKKTEIANKLTNKTQIFRDVISSAKNRLRLNRNFMR